DAGYLTYQWHRSAKFTTAFATPLSAADKATIVASGITLTDQSATTATLTTRTPSDHGYYYYWVEITNHLVADDGSEAAPAKTTSDPAQIRVFNEIVADTYTVGEKKADGSTYSQQDYDTYYRHNIKQLGKEGYYEWAGNQLFTQIRGGDFETKWDDFYHVQARRDTPYWDTTHGLGNWQGRTFPKVMEIQANSEFNATGTGMAAELSAAVQSSIYEELATVPGRIYEWSLDQNIHGNWQTVPDIMAVIIGPAADTDASDPVFSPWQYGLDADAGQTDPTTGQLTAYTNVDTSQSTLFRGVLNQLATDLGITDKDTLDHDGHVTVGRQNGQFDEFLQAVNGEKEYTNQAYSVTYQGRNYYVYLAATDWPVVLADGVRREWTHHTGALSIPEGQGRTVFGFASVFSTQGGQLGNVLDNIVFASGADLGAAGTTTLSSGSQISVTTKPGFAYGLAQVRGSAPSKLTGLEGDVFFTPSGGAEAAAHPTAVEGNTSDWYVPGAAGTLTFKDLMPGGTYRIVGVPIGAVSAAFGTNTDPSRVLDEGYYKDVTLASVATAGDTQISNATAQVYTDEKGAVHARVTVEHTDSRVQYAIVNKDGTVGAMENGSPWFSGATQNVVFQPLGRNTEFFIVSRPAGYSEITPASALKSEAAIAIKTPSLADIQVADVSRVREASGKTDAIHVVVAKDHSGLAYGLVDTATGKLATQKTATVSGTATSVTLNFTGLSTTTTYQVVQKESTGTWSTGVRAYPAPAALTVNYAQALLGTGTTGTGAVAATVEYRIAAVAAAGLTNPSTATALTWLAGTADTWATGLGSAAIDLGAPDVTSGTILSTLRGVSGAAGAVVSYRLKAGSDGYTGAAVRLTGYVTFTSRPAAPVKETDYTLAFQEFDDERIHALSALEFETETGAAWTQAKAGSYVTFAALGWTGAVTKTMSVRKPATTTAFASWESTETLPARGPAPTYVRAKLADDGTVTLT
ncbi:MAG: hypothetical protein LBR33_09115, partial [Propionibacteriaceae bacterium]|nr:hypothetical protein [Propionibacteriaceae bacterium]